jgi:hypothetical protein
LYFYRLLHARDGLLRTSLQQSGNACSQLETSLRIGQMLLLIPAFFSVGQVNKY